MTLRRTLLLLAGLVLVASLGLGWWWWSHRDFTAEVASRLSEALGRPVTIGRMAIDPRGMIDLYEVTIADVAPFEGTQLLHAEHIDLEVSLSALLDREIVGVVSVQAVELHVTKRDGATNLAGLLPRRGASTGGVAQVHLDVALHDAKLRIEDADRGESLELEGVDVRALLDNRDDAPQAEVALEIDRVSLHGVTLDHVVATARASRDAVALQDLHASLGEHGTLEGHGELFLRGDRSWRFAISLADVDLAGDVRPLVSSLYPPLSASVDATAASGSLGAELTVSATGLHWPRVRESLIGSGVVRLHDVALPAQSLLVDLAALAGRSSDAVHLRRVAIEFTAAQGWITLARVTTDGEQVDVPLTGRVGFDGTLDLRADLMPLVAVFGGGAYRAVARHATSLPVRIEGTLDAPRLAPPRASEIGASLLGGAIRRALEQP
ncbi:MAG: hypothetical protein IPH07_21660 [Deltaproteobacteria bacterium]|nr:hypothetical protein [Deltaproteobacteria bacterium]MBP7290749.1 hypothetical protein [Nannocystaceae bacterium]